MYPRLLERMQDPEVYEADPVRFEIMRHFGAFVTESSGHLSEYVPYFRKRPDLLKQYTREGYRGESGFYANNWPDWRQGGDDSIREILEGRAPLTMQRSEEYASYIAEAIELDQPQVIHGNVLNTGLIDNLPRANQRGFGAEVADFEQRFLGAREDVIRLVLTEQAAVDQLL